MFMSFHVQFHVCSFHVHFNENEHECFLADTAGIRKVKNKVEKEGIKRAIKKAKDADLTLVMVDASKKTINKDLKKLINKDCILVFNKSDLSKKPPKNEFQKNDVALFRTIPRVSFSF